uniref:Single domain-containing protein n=1 Tax=Glossina palpalis gambiensis TaxID=67801 RepID=A0A1B0ALP6_9MUSC
MSLPLFAHIEFANTENNNKDYYVDLKSHTLNEIVNTVKYDVYRDDYVLILKHCDRILLNPYCRQTTYDYTRPYPDCCPKLYCNYIFDN